MIVTDPGDNLTLVESGFVTAPSGERVLSGAIRNNTDHAYYHVQVDIGLLDEDGREVGSTIVTTSDLGAQEAWRFEVPIDDDHVSRAVIDGQCGRRYSISEEIRPAS